MLQWIGEFRSLAPAPVNAMDLTACAKSLYKKRSLATLLGMNFYKNKIIAASSSKPNIIAFDTLLLITSNILEALSNVKYYINWYPSILFYKYLHKRRHSPWTKFCFHKQVLLLEVNLSTMQKNVFGETHFPRQSCQYPGVPLVIHMLPWDFILYHHA